VTRQKILITGASSGLSAGMARAFAAKGRDLALCARRADRLDELKTELSQQYPGIAVAVATTGQTLRVGGASRRKSTRTLGVSGGFASARRTQPTRPRSVR
jgi:NADP-dependent 3-hydroxy acid dehydrogenase YdfG